MGKNIINTTKNIYISFSLPESLNFIYHKYLGFLLNPALRFMICSESPILWSNNKYITCGNFSPLQKKTVISNLMLIAGTNALFCWKFSWSFCVNVDIIQYQLSSSRRGWSWACWQKLQKTPNKKKNKYVNMTQYTQYDLEHLT